MELIDYDNLIVQEKLFAIEIVNDDTVKVLELGRRSSKYFVVGYASESIEKKAIKNGIIVDPESVARAISIARQNARPKKIKVRHAIVVLPNSRVFIRVVNFPLGMRKEEIREAIEWKAKDIIAMPLDKVYWDWHRLSENIGKNSESIEVIISAVDKECVDSYVKTLSLLNITPLYFDISANAAARCIFQNSYQNKKAILVRIDKESTTISVFVKGGVRCQTLNTNVVRGGYRNLVDYASAKLGLDLAEAEKAILNEKNLNSAQKQILVKAFNTYFSNLYNDINQVIDYYSKMIFQKGNEKEIDSFDGIYFYGKGASVFGLEEFFSSKSIKIKKTPEIKTEVSPMLPFISRESLSENLVILGLAMRNLCWFKDIRDINLVPWSVKKTFIESSIYKSFISYLKLVFWNIIVMCFILAFVFFIAQSYKVNVQNELKSVQNVAESPANKAIREKITNLNETARNIDLLLRLETNWDKFFDDLYQSKGGEISLKSIYITEDSEAWKTISGDKKSSLSKNKKYLIISGTALTRSSLKNFTEKVEKISYIEDVKMPISNFEKNENIEFTIYSYLDIEKLGGKND